jgi:type IX secretion system substrate protein
MFRKILLVTCCIAPVTLLAQGSFKISSATTLKLTGGAIITLDNMHLENDGDLSLTAGDGTFWFTGNLNTDISGSSLPLFDIMEIAKSGGAELSLQRSISVVSVIGFNSGLFNLNNNNILLQPTAYLTGESETSRITGINGGFIEITNNLNAPVSQNPGNLGAMITSLQNLGSTIIRRGHMAQVVGNQNATNRYFDIIPTSNSSLNAVLRFHYFDAELNGGDENNLVLWKSADNVNWNEIGFDTRNTTTNYVEKTGIADFSRWSLQSPSGALPVIFTLLNARCENGKIIISWKTAQEFNSSRFGIERSINGRDWTVIGTVAASGNSTIESNYQFMDANPGAFMYRIAEYDINGRVMYTTIIRSSCEGKDVINIWPNPVQDLAWLNINISVASSAIVRLYDAKGSLVLVKRTVLMPGANQFPVPMKKLAQGMYELKVEYGTGKMKTFKLVKY